MCGILGVIGVESLPKNISAASDLIAHRGPDGSGVKKLSFLSNEGIPLAVEFAHRRLAIVDLTERGEQPFVDQQGRVLVYNGEIFNWRSLRSELESYGYEFFSDTDTEVILAGYDYWKFGVFERLNGFWALGLFDPHDSNGPSLILSRDRCGIKPLYYSRPAVERNGLYFSSEIRSLFALQGGGAHAVVPEKVVEFIVNGFLSVDGATIYKNVNEFPVASYAIFKPNSGNITFFKYWDVPSGIGEINDEEHAVDVFSETIEDAVDLWIQADVPVGLTLSSGIDSSVIAVAAANRGYRDITAFTSHFPGSPLDEFGLAGELASKLGMRHIPVTPNLDDVMEELPEFAKHQEMLFTSFSQFVAWCVLREIKASGYKAFLAGQGGDELFLGYQRYLSSYIRSRHRESGTCFHKAMQVYRNTDLGWMKMLGFLIYFSGNKIRKFRGGIRARKIFNSRYLKEGLSSAMQAVPADFHSLQYSETLGTPQLRRLLRFDDRSASAFGLEGRPVLLDHRVVEFAFRLSPGLLIKDGWTKYILRKYLERNGCADIAWRKKKLGFPAPDNIWSQQWLNSNWQAAKGQSALSDILVPNLTLDNLGNWENLSLAVLAMTAKEMEWQ